MLAAAIVLVQLILSQLALPAHRSLRHLQILILLLLQVLVVGIGVAVWLGLELPAMAESLS